MFQNRIRNPQDACVAFLWHPRLLTNPKKGTNSKTGKKSPHSNAMCQNREALKWLVSFWGSPPSLSPSLPSPFLVALCCSPSLSFRSWLFRPYSQSVLQVNCSAHIQHGKFWISFIVSLKCPEHPASVLSSTVLLGVLCPNSQRGTSDLYGLLAPFSIKLEGTLAVA